jgi:hypothetical protein
VKLQDEKYAPKGEGSPGILFDCEEGRIDIGPWDDAINFDPPGIAARFHMPGKFTSRNQHINYCSAHYNNFLECIRTRRRPNADVEINLHSFILTHLACIGYRLNRDLRWDPIKEDFINDPEASRYLDAVIRAPWHI